MTANRISIDYISSLLGVSKNGRFAYDLNADISGIWGQMLDGVESEYLFSGHVDRVLYNYNTISDISSLELHFTKYVSTHSMLMCTTSVMLSMHSDQSHFWISQFDVTWGSTP